VLCRFRAVVCCIYPNLDPVGSNGKRHLHPKCDSSGKSFVGLVEIKKTKKYKTKPKKMMHISALFSKVS
ncbi:MAG: hypothetical protein V3R78_14440, partial [Thermodesulfobacteriota bacterium]